MDSIALFFCKDFPEVVRKAQRNERTFLDTRHSVVDGLVCWNGEAASALISQEASDFIDSMATNGYTLTAYLRLSDLFAVIPITEESEKAVAMVVNERILAKAFPEALPN
jgi:hypothetical protein